MKSILKKFAMLFVTVFASFIGYMQVSAYSSTLVSSSNTVNPGEEFTIKINLSGLDSNGLAAATYNVQYNSRIFEYVKISPSGYTVNNTGSVVKIGYVDITAENPKSNGTFATLTFKVKSTITTDTTATFTLTSGGLSDKDGGSLTSENKGVSVKVHIPDTDNTLKSLSISGATISFDKDKLNYEVTINSSTTKITAVANSEYASISGTGSKNLSYGLNTYNVVVTSESGAKRTYTIKVTRPDNRSNNNNLSSLSIEGVTLNFKFSQTTYKLNIDKDYIVIKATSEDPKATVSGDIGKQTLTKGQTKNFKINVKSEKGNVKTYTISVTRPDNRSDNNYLSSLTVSSGTLAFDKNIFEYKFSVPYNVETIDINAVAEDSKAKVTINKPDKLVVGENLITVTCKAENGSLRNYKITITKVADNTELSTDNYLTDIKITNYDIPFNKDVMSYDLKINNESTLDIQAVRSSSKANVQIIGNENLKNGSVITIRVTSESGSARDYKITIIMDEVSSEEKDYMMYVYIGGGVLLLILIIIIILSKKKKKNNNVDNNNGNDGNNMSDVVGIGMSSVSDNINSDTDTNMNTIVNPTDTSNNTQSTVDTTSYDKSFSFDTSMGNVNNAVDVNQTMQNVSEAKSNSNVDLNNTTPVVENVSSNNTGSTSTDNSDSNIEVL